MAANLFVLYFAVISYITPPVALASYTAAGLAQADFFRTGWTAFKLGLSGFLIPFMAVYGPSLVLVGTPFEIMTSFATAILGVTLMGCALEAYCFGPLKRWAQVVLFLGSLCLIKPGFGTDLIGIAIGLLFALYLFLSK